jgi:hypothetical protein
MEVMEKSTEVKSNQPTEREISELSSSRRLQKKLDLITHKLCEHLRAVGTQLIYHDGHWRTRIDRQWQPLDQEGLAQLDNTIGLLCHGTGLNFGTRGSLIKRHLRASWEFAPTPADRQQINTPTTQMTSEQAQ